MNLKTIAVGLVALASAATASAAVNLVQNGSFEQSSYTPTAPYAGIEIGVDIYNTGYITQGVTNWTATLSGGITYYYNVPAIASTNTVRERFNDALGILSVNYTGPSPDGGNFVGFDADFIGDAPPTYGPYNSPFVQTITGLTVGATYKLTYYWAATQLQNRTGATTNRLTASLGTESYSTATLNLPSQGFSGWAKVTNYFTAQNTSDSLTFLALGTPAGGPPFTLLDGVTLTAVPEAATWAMLVVGFGLVGAAARRRRPMVAA